ncbi:MAG: methyl-accepting chemotaxis protein [Desulfobacterales bacterium]|nr:methyl-accepting chemotaxis protein [Desulfobacterales bacterium]
MSKYRKYGFKTILTRIIILAFLGIGGMTAITWVNNMMYASITDDVEIGSKTSEIIMNFLEMMVIEEKFIGSENFDLLSQHDDRRNLVKRQISELKALVYEEDSLEMIQHINRLTQDYSKVSDSLKQSIAQIQQSKADMAAILRQMTDSLERVITLLDNEETDLMMHGEFLDPVKVVLRNEIKDFITLWNKKSINIQKLFLTQDVNFYKKNREEIEERIKIKMKNAKGSVALADKEEFTKIWDDIQHKILLGLKQKEDALYDAFKRNIELKKSLDSTNRNIRKEIQTIAESVKKRLNTGVDGADRFNIILSLCGLCVFIFISGLILSSVIKGIRIIIRILRQNSENLATSSDNLAYSSRRLAEDASEQAASLEETASWLEQMSAMASQNAHNSSQANGLISEMIEVINAANRHMKALTESMESISKRSDETFKVIKSIDGIAFQTNLIALNASVEAARAGESGAGFAVVANEVRNLALLVADEAGNTADLIEETANQIKQGADLVTQANTSFTKVSQTSDTVRDIMKRIADASQEQAKGVEQTSRAMNDLDQVTQQNTASSSEIANESQDMKLIVKEMEFSIVQLASLIGWKKRLLGGEQRKPGTGPLLR